MRDALALWKGRPFAGLSDEATSVRLEAAFWVALDEICERESVTLDALCLALETRCRACSRAAALRAFVVGYLGDDDPVATVRGE